MDERRNGVRVEAKIELDIKELSGSCNNITVTSSNISAKGLSFYSSCNFMVGSTLELVLKCESLNSTTSVKGEVVWCKKISFSTEDLFATGINVQEESRQQMAKFMSKYLKEVINELGV